MKGIDKMSFLETAKKRFSVRKYTDKIVENEKIEKLIEAAHYAPTGANRQPVRLITVQNPDNLKKVSKAANIYGAPLAIIVCGDKSRAWVREYDKKNIVDIDASIITDHIMHEATELELGSVWICHFKPDVLKSELNIPENLEPINILAIGYTDEKSAPDRHKTARIPVSELVYKEM